jgi:hypothetical protein
MSAWDEYSFAVWRVRPLSGAKAERVGTWKDEKEAKRVAAEFRSWGELSYVLVSISDNDDSRTQINK